MLNSKTFLKQLQSTNNYNKIVFLEIKKINLKQFFILECSCSAVNFIYKPNLLESAH